MALQRRNNPCEQHSETNPEWCGWGESRTPCSSIVRNLAKRGHASARTSYSRGVNPEPNPRQLRWLLAGAGAALVSVLVALVALQPAEASPDWLQFLGRFHPLFVHLPIGVVLLLAAAEVASAKASVRERLDPVILPVLVVLVATALPAFILGLMLAHGGGYPEALRVPHQRFASIGLVFACTSVAAWSLYRHRSSSRWRHGYRALLGASLVALGVGAHFGGSMTHGETYLVRYAPEPLARWLGVEPPQAVVFTSAPAEEPSVYANAVQPVLAKYCVDCHGPDKAKGGLRLDSYAELLKGGDSGPAIVARAPDKSRLVTLLGLPEADVDHMPPEGKPQPSQAQIELISWWILRGASEHERVREVLPPADVLELLKAADRPAKPRPAPNIMQ